MNAGLGAHPVCYEAKAELQGLSMPLRACSYQLCEQGPAVDQEDGGFLGQLSSVTAAMTIHPGNPPEHAP